MKPKLTFAGIITIILLSIFCIQANAQHVNYTYDANGNRILRHYSSTLRMADTSKSNPEADKIASHYGIGVYPNPLMDGSSVTVIVKAAKESQATNATGEELAPTEASEATVYVLDNTGKMLYSQKQPTASPSQIDLSGYSTGIYYIKVAIGKEQLFYKITKAK